MSRVRNSNFIDSIDECLSNGVKNGIFQVSLEDDHLNGRTVTIGGREVVNYGSCSYLGLEVDDRLKQGAIDATLRYGTQYSSSRAYSSCNLYEELEDLFYKIFDNTPAILAATTTLTHIAAIPILVQNEDLVILDHQVHGSVQVAVQLVKARGTKVHMIRHNRMDQLEDLIKENPNKYNKIWYMADGLYSMYGDYAPLKDIEFLMEKYPNFHLYIDDAHGMSWTGRHGNGYVLSQMGMHPKMILTTSLAKGFGTGGGLIVASDREMMRKILTCGSSYTFSGPVQPPMLGASIASAKIHLSDDIYTLQDSLKSKLELMQNLIRQYDLPLVYPSNSPIFYIGLGLPRTGYNMVKRLLNEGYYTNIGIFPGVPVKCTGLRLPVNNRHTEEDLKGVIEAFAYHLPKVLEEEGVTVDHLSKSFNLPFEETKKRYPVGVEAANDLSIQHETDIHKIDKATWDELLGGNGTFDWEGCKLLQETFRDNEEQENNWQMHYLIIRDKEAKPVLATFFTELLCKDDMIAPASVSEQIEEIRKKDKYYLTSKVIMMGSLLSVGNHLFLDKTNPAWTKAMLEMIRVMNEAKQKSGASMIQLRDLDSTDEDLRDFLVKEGFVKVEMPDAHVMENITWDSVESYVAGLSLNGRKNLKRTVLKNRDDFDVKVRKEGGKPLAESPAVLPEEIEYWHRLYLNVKKQSFSLNTFNIPLKFFQNAVANPDWDVIELSLKSGESDKSVAVVFSHISSHKNSSPTVIGLDYNYVLSHGSYRQGVFQSVLRARALNCNKMYLGMDASVEKRKFGVKVLKKSVYIQANDNFNMELIGTVYNEKTRV